MTVVADTFWHGSGTGLSTGMGVPLEMVGMHPGTGTVRRLCNGQKDRRDRCAVKADAHSAQLTFAAPATVGIVKGPTIALLWTPAAVITADPRWVE